jgi:2-keto-4-pentenoate hydratase/2-oxohepta-3-ene-1,7-dioic acid hydratase in catechol pathway
MKLCRFEISGSTHSGKIVDGAIVDLSPVAGVGESMRELLAALPSLRPALEAATAPRLPIGEARLLAPIVDPQKYLAIGMNYKAHAEEAAAAGLPIPTSQLWFNKQVSCLSGPYDPIELPKVSDKLDYEAELAFVIGKRCKHVSADQALSVVGGYLVANDVSVRDWQLRSPTYTLGKSFDTHGPIGPWITTADEVPDPHTLSMRCTVNGEQRQSSSTGDMIYRIQEQIAYLSTVMTLEPGDLIATGTPSGVGIASNRFLKQGDVVRVEIERLGAIENTVRAEH